MYLSNELIKKLNDYPAFKEFQTHIMEEAVKLNSIDEVDFQGLSDERIGEIIRANYSAKKILDKILQPFLEFNEKPEYTDQDKKKQALKFGIT
jgi:hypothetical protein